MEACKQNKLYSPRCAAHAERAPASFNAAKGVAIEMLLLNLSTGAARNAARAAAGLL
jgi:hypothetical protein